MGVHLMGQTLALSLKGGSRLCHITGFKSYDEEWRPVEKLMRYYGCVLID